MIPVPNQSNAFFASGFNMVDPTVRGGLENMNKRRVLHHQKSNINMDLQKSKVKQDYETGKSNIDYTNSVLKNIRRQTPLETNVNLKKIKRIQQQARNKISYAYKDKFCGMYEDKLRAGLLHKDDSLEKFVNPDVKVGLNNTLQHALNSEALEEGKKVNIRAKQSGGQETETSRRPTQNSKSPEAAQIVKTLDSHIDKNNPSSFRNTLERFQYQYQEEKTENINTMQTLDRVAKYNKMYDPIIERSKLSIKLYNLLGYSKTQYSVYRKILHWMRNYEASAKKEKANIQNIQFARDFFSTIDGNASGKSTIHDVAVPIVALGLSSNSNFIQRVMRAINPAKFKNSNLDSELTLKDFVKIFERDERSVKFTDLLCQRILERSMQVEQSKKRAKEQLSITKGRFTVKVLHTDSSQETQQFQRNSSPSTLMQQIEDLDQSSIGLDTHESAYGQKFKISRVIAQKPAKLDSEKLNETQKLTELSKITQTQMLDEVRKIWLENVEGDENILETDLSIISEYFCKHKVFADTSTAEKYIQQTLQRKITRMYYDDFVSIFSKGIFRHAIVSLVHNIDTEHAQNQNACPEEKLEFKIMRQKNKSLMKEIDMGRITSPEQLSQVIDRPILRELWSLSYYDNTISESKLDAYTHNAQRIVVDKLQNLTDSIITNPNFVRLDEFAKYCGARETPIPGAMNIIADNHQQMSQDPYNITEDDHIVPKKVTKLGMKNQPTSTIQSIMNRRQKRAFTVKQDVAMGRRVSNRSNSQALSQISSKNSGGQSFAQRRKSSNVVGKQISPKGATATTGKDNQGRKKSQGHNTTTTTQDQNNGIHLQSINFSGGQTANNPAANPAASSQYDLKLSENPTELAAQRKQRFESMVKFQSIVEMTEERETPGRRFLKELETNKKLKKDEQ